MNGEKESELWRDGKKTDCTYNAFFLAGRTKCLMFHEIPQTQQPGARRKYSRNDQRRKDGQLEEERGDRGGGWTDQTGVPDGWIEEKSRKMSADKAFGIANWLALAFTLEQDSVLKVPLECVCSSTQDVKRVRAHSPAGLRITLDRPPNQQLEPDFPRFQRRSEGKQERRRQAKRLLPNKALATQVS